MVAFRDPVRNVVGGPTAKEMTDRLGITTVEDLLRHYPRRYYERGELTDLARLVPGDLATPTFVAIVSSDADEATAQQRRDELTENGYASNVLHSDDFTSLEPGFWVAYVGPFPDPAAAQAAVDQLAADGYTSAYPRCIGTAEEC